MAPLGSTPDYLGFGYAALLGLGGLMGGIKRGSTISLVAGLGSAAAAGYGANRVSNNAYDVDPSLYTASALFVLMVYRFAKTGKVMPAGLVAALSLGMAVRYYSFKL
ncbi:hypothetical protein IAU59_005073 [Kwoniella sp. CBS 9459]